MNTGARDLPPQLAEAAAAQVPTSLYYSTTTVMPRVLALVGLGIAWYVWSSIRGVSVPWLPMAILAAVVIGAAVATTTKRIDLDKNTLTLVPLLPILRKQRLPLGRVGTFREIPISSVRADLDFGTGYRYAWVYPTSTLRLELFYGPSHGSRPLTATQFSALVDAYRPAAAARHTVPSASRRVPGAPHDARVTGGDGVQGSAGHSPSVRIDPLLPPETNLLAYGGVVSCFAAIAGAWLLLLHRHALADAAVALIGLLVAAEGLGLVTNWRGGADRVGDMIRGTPRTTDVELNYFASGQFVRGNAGLLALFCGCVFLWAAIHYWP